VGFGESQDFLIKNAIRFFVDEEKSFSFCVPETEQHIVRIELSRNGGDTVIISERGTACESVMLETGRYLLDIYHNGRGIDNDGVTAFLHQSVASESGTYPPYDFMAYRARDNNFVTSATGSAKLVGTTPDVQDVGPEEIWYFGKQTAHFTTTQGNGEGLQLKFCHGSDGGNYLLAGGDKSACKFDSIETANIQWIPWHSHFRFKLYLNDHGLSDNSSASGYLFVDEATDWKISWVGTDDIWTAEYYGFCYNGGCDPFDPPQGQVALYAECDFQGPAVIFGADTPDMSLYERASAAGQGFAEDAIRSIRIGPNTEVTLFSDVQFQGTGITIAEHISCLDATELGNDELSSFKIISQEIVNYIISSKGCQHCVLSDLDFESQDFEDFDFSNSKLDSVNFSGTNLTGAVFSNANLSDASFLVANLTNANFSGARTSLEATDFSGAIQECTNFSGTDLTSATFVNNAIIRDFSCRLNLSSTTLNYNTFVDTDWRYFDLTSSIMHDVPIVLSSPTARLDLSGGIFNSVTWLVGKKLDGVNLGCYASEVDQTTVCPAPNGNKVCSTLQGIDLVGASLKNACLEQAAMEGAFLSASNLDGADLSGVQLKDFKEGNPATLDGAFMRNVNLSGADLTGVSANNVNFYTVAGGTADATGVIATGADFSGSYLAFADFSGSASNLQSTTWTNTMLLGTNFEQADLSTNTSGGVNSGTATKFNGAYMQGTNFADAIIDNVNFTSTYWDTLGSGGSLNFLIPNQNLGFSGYWKDISLPECPLALEYDSGNPPPMNMTNSNNTCPNGGPGPCDSVWDDPLQAISLAFFQSAVPPLFPQDDSATSENQCSSDFSDPNPEDFCWIITNNPSSCPENVLDE
jgi:uncharacterized protein YjbI with pentapeptide repeats